jgi:hypothetical protein
VSEKIWDIPQGFEYGEQSEAILVRFGFGDDVQKPAAGDDFRGLVALRKMPRVAGHKVISLGCFGAFEKAVVTFGNGIGQLRHGDGVSSDLI